MLASVHTNIHTVDLVLRIEARAARYQRVYPLACSGGRGGGPGGHGSRDTRLDGMNRG